MKSIKVIFSFLVLLISYSSYSQLSKGMLKMEVSGIKMNGEEAPPEMASHLGNMDISIFSNGVIQKSVMTMMMMKTTTIMDTNLDSIYIYMDMMGKKYKISENRKAKSDEVNDKLKAAQEDMEIKEFPEDVKEILGFKCHRIDVKMKKTAGRGKDDDQQLDMKMYVTNDLHLDPSYVTQTGKNLAIKGTPLEYNMTMGGGSFQMDITMLAKEYKKDIVPDDLLPPTGNFKNYTMDQFNEEMLKIAK